MGSGTSLAYLHNVSREYIFLIDKQNEYQTKNLTYKRLISLKQNGEGREMGLYNQR